MKKLMIAVFLLMNGTLALAQNTNCSVVRMDAGLDQFCDNGRVKTHVNKIEFYYEDTSSNYAAFQDFGIRVSGQAFEMCAGADNKYCDDYGDNYYSRARFLGVDADIDFARLEGGRQRIDLRNASLSLVELTGASGQGPAVSSAPIFGSDRDLRKMQLLQITYKSGGRSQIMNVQVPVTLINMEHELHYNLTKDGVLKVLINGQVDASAGVASINTNADYQRFNARASFSGQGGLIIADRIRIAGQGQRAFNSNIIDSESSFGGNVSIRATDRFYLKGSFTRSSLSLRENPSHLIQEEKTNRLRLGVGIKF